MENINNNSELKKSSRIYALDTIKAILIFLVVFAHFLEENLTGKTTYVYTVIYMFHMPVFIFCSGFLFKFHRKKFITKIVLVYLIFQTIYTIFSQKYLSDVPIKLNYTTPYWIMWYMLALGMWGLTANLLDTNDKRKQVLIVTILFALGVLVGMDNTVGYYMTLSRFFVFLPFFMVGFYIRKSFDVYKFKCNLNKWIKVIITIGCIVTIVGICYIIYKIHGDYIVSTLYGSYPYESLNYTYKFRLMQYAFATLFTIFFVWIIPNRKLFFQYIGRNTLIIYLAHGFIVKTVFYNKLLQTESTMEYFIQTMIVSLLIVVILPLPFILCKKIITCVSNKIKNCKFRGIILKE